MNDYYYYYSTGNESTGGQRESTPLFYYLDVVIVNNDNDNVRKKNCSFTVGPFMCLYRAIQAGLLTPLTFARHCLSPLGASTSGAYFLHNGRR